MIERDTGPKRQEIGPQPEKEAPKIERDDSDGKRPSDAESPLDGLKTPDAPGLVDDARKENGPGPSF